jgi:hypothetical protein
MTAAGGHETNDDTIVDADRVIEQSIAMAARMLDSMHKALPGEPGGAPNIDQYVFSGRFSEEEATSVRMTWSGKAGEKNVTLGWSGMGQQMIDDMTADLADHLMQHFLGMATPLSVVAATVEHDNGRVVERLVIKKVMSHLKLGDYHRMNAEWKQTRRDSEAEKRVEAALAALRNKWKEGELYVPINEDGGWTRMIFAAADELMNRAQKIHACTQKSLQRFVQEEQDTRREQDENVGRTPSDEEPTGRMRSPGRR